MRLPFLWGLVLSLSVGTLTVSAQDKSDAATIRALEMKWTESYKQRNIDILSSLLADDFVITVENGSVYSKAGYISHSADSSVHVEVAELSELKVRMHGDTAIVTGAYHELGESNGRRYEYRDRLTDVWMKTGGRWQVIASHYSVPYKE
ncbi:MAG: nuclear transport factor 2 family protein [Candidatus Sulfotelmatobacter sp.]